MGIVENFNKHSRRIFKLNACGHGLPLLSSTNTFRLLSSVLISDFYVGQ